MAQQPEVATSFGDSKFSLLKIIAETHEQPQSMQLQARQGILKMLFSQEVSLNTDDQDFADLFERTERYEAPPTISRLMRDYADHPILQNLDELQNEVFDSYSAHQIAQMHRAAAVMIHLME